MLAVTACDYSLGPDDVVISEPFAYQLDAVGRNGLQVVGVNGPITVTGESQGGAVAVTGVRTVRGCSSSEAEQWIDRLEVRVDDSAETIVLRTVQPQHTDRCSLEVEYEVSVPARFSTEIVNVNGDVQVRGLDGGTFVTNVNGSVGLHDLTAPVRVLLTNGTIAGDAVVRNEESVDLRTVNGNVELAIPTGSSAVLMASLANGTIRVVNLALSGVVSTRTTLTGTLGTGEGEIRLQTTNGNVTVTGS